MENTIDNSYIVGTFFVSLLAFVVQLILRRRTSNSVSHSRKIIYGYNNVFKNRSDLTCGECFQPRYGSVDADVIIVGAGVSGAALAHTLGKEGRKIRVIERDLTEPDRIVGELLQPGGYLKLIELGLQDCVEEIDAQRILGYALFKDGKITKLPYPLEKFCSGVSGRAFHNGRFVQRMREKAATLPNVTMEQGTVTSLIEDEGTIRGVQYKNKSGQVTKVFAPLTIVCDGCFSNLRRSLCKPQVEVPSCFVGLVLKNCELPYPNHGHVVLADPSPILFYPISSNEVRCLVDIPGQNLPSLGNGDMSKYLKTIVAPQVPPEVHAAFMAAIDSGNIKTMPNRSMPASPVSTPGALLLGDAFNMRHPLTGGGMTVALADIVVLRDLLKPLHDFTDANLLTKYLESFYTLRKPVASTINTLAGALYVVFCASPDKARKEMREACFDYLSLGGICSTGPVGLLSGLNPSPVCLVLHFFAVAVYGFGRLMLPIPTPKRLWLGVRLILGASGIIFPIIKAEGVRQMFFPASVPAYNRASSKKGSQ
ncbi:putative squalene monooxygenase [Helianthus annuus]|uniref:Squalene monooxygenase n=1 Tax=Helianthus annuus TaxID=4232 RepID=A0A251UZU4_HELAN|nr:squalene epoxidase 3 [Helianthus annuus]KAF5798790.1 putative squalene monooxygenase [Helianthus annuus]KAJ0550346.1 putative squalene monooxygenase [Helianthus annuus]KAJ0557043.1 putative squalene monooxygenase [Helianthus annuus]KAJ0563301.1 putative squalene monooxygenase [Helianthus annuus]KAJ0728649.1 putative squalene monooxygenase [Helianthus annuus]